MFDIYTAKESYGYINNLPINEGSYVFTECDESNRINALIDYYIESKSIAEARILLNQIKEYIEVCDNSNLQINLDPTQKKLYQLLSSEQDLDYKNLSQFWLLNLRKNNLYKEEIFSTEEVTSSTSPHSHKSLNL